MDDWNASAYVPAVAPPGTSDRAEPVTERVDKARPFMDDTQPFFIETTWRRLTPPYTDARFGMRSRKRTDNGEPGAAYPTGHAVAGLRHGWPQRGPQWQDIRRIRQAIPHEQ
jgi:hypothetical protein